MEKCLELFCSMVEILVVVNAIGRLKDHPIVPHILEHFDVFYESSP